jgi:hypothetical protein
MMEPTLSDQVQLMDSTTESKCVRTKLCEKCLISAEQTDILKSEREHERSLEDARREVTQRVD